MLEEQENGLIVLRNKERVERKRNNLADGDFDSIATPPNQIQESQVLFTNSKMLSVIKREGDETPLTQSMETC